MFLQSDQAVSAPSLGTALIKTWPQGIFPPLKQFFIFSEVESDDSCKYYFVSLFFKYSVIFHHIKRKRVHFREKFFPWILPSMRAVDLKASLWSFLPPLVFFDSNSRRRWRLKKIQIIIGNHVPPSGDGEQCNEGQQDLKLVLIVHMFNFCISCAFSVKSSI